MARITELEKSTSTSIIVVNGVSMTLGEYKKQLQEKRGVKPTKRAKRVNEVSEVSKEIEAIVKQITILKSLSAYWDNGYRQWGNIAKEILNLRYIRPHFVHYRLKVSELQVLMAEIEKLSKRSETSVYQYVEKLSWKLDDIKTDITNIMQGVDRCGVLSQFKGHECINGNGRRLGLNVLMRKASKALSEIETAVKTLEDIAKDGADIMTLQERLSPKAYRRLLC